MLRRTPRNKRIRWSWPTAALLLLAGCGDSADTPRCSVEKPCGIQSGTTIRLDDGALEGASEAGVRRFMAIPYAAPPLDALRFAPPAATVPWEGTRQAQEAGPPCVQRDFLSGELVDDGSEDCLTLNVWTPEAPTEPLPVMVWIHGGGFEGGSGDADGGYAGDVLVSEQNVVVVTLNYRLGPLGFLAHPALSAEDTAHPTSGNYGLEDQRAALQWVQRNILAFGGDPDNVTVFGESAGGIGVCAQLVSPAAQGLLHGAIIESGPCGLTTQTLAQSETQGEQLAEALGCDDSADVGACLRQASAADVTLALPNVPGLIVGDGARWGPNVDGVVLPDTPQQLVEQGQSADVPVLIGTNKDEGTLFVWLAQLQDLDEAGYQQLIEAHPQTGANSEAILARYPASDYDSPAAALSTLLSDLLFSCPTRRTARALLQNGQPLYRYQFVYEPAFFVPNLGAFHAAELPFVFGHDAFGFGDTTEDAPELAQAMRGYWAAFAAHGDPNHAGPPAWPRYDDSEPYLELDSEISEKNDLLADTCDFWDSL